MTTATLTNKLTLSYGNAWFDVKGLTKAEFEKNLTPDFFKHEQKFWEQCQRESSHDWEHSACCEESLFNLKLAELALANGNLKVKKFKLDCCEDWDGEVDEDLYQYCFELEFVVTTV